MPINHGLSTRKCLGASVAIASGDEVLCEAAENQMLNTEKDDSKKRHVAMLLQLYISASRRDLLIENPITWV